MSIPSFQQAVNAMQLKTETFYGQSAKVKVVGWTKQPLSLLAISIKCAHYLKKHTAFSQDRTAVLEVARFCKTQYDNKIDKLNAFVRFFWKLFYPASMKIKELDAAPITSPSAPLFRVSPPSLDTVKSWQTTWAPLVGQFLGCSVEINLNTHTFSAREGQQAPGLARVTKTTDLDFVQHADTLTEPVPAESAIIYKIASGQAPAKMTPRFHPLGDGFAIMFSLRGTLLIIDTQEPKRNWFLMTAERQQMMLTKGLQIEALLASQKGLKPITDPGVFHHHVGSLGGQTQPVAHLRVSNQNRKDLFDKLDNLAGGNGRSLANQLPKVTLS